MTKEEYRELLKDWRWEERRLEILERDGYECQCCGAIADDALLQVHHRYYEDGLLPWEYPDDALVTLCEDCHKDIHRNRIMTVY